MKKVKQSFTLVEILVVIVIIGILSSFIFFTVNDSVEKANLAKTKMFEEAIRNNLLMNLVSEWKFDGDAKDSWGNYDGELKNFNFNEESGWQSESDCISGKCLKFDGFDDAVVFNAIDLKKDYTLMAWVNPDSATSSDWFNIISNNNHPQFGCPDESLKITLYHRITGETIKRYKWSNIALIRNNTYYEIYINGKFIKHQDTTYGNDAYRVIGAFTYESDLITNREPWHGLIDEVKIYNTAIPESQIKQEYLAGLNNLYAKGLITQLEYNQKLSLLNYE